MLAGSPARAVSVPIAAVGTHPPIAVARLAAEAVTRAIAAITALPADGRPACANKEDKDQKKAIHWGRLSWSSSPNQTLRECALLQASCPLARGLTIPSGVSEANESERKKKAPPAFWVPSTYFAEGFPYAVVNNLAEILFKELGASLSVVGLTSLFHLPWNLKFLWGPLLDQYETKRRWLFCVEVALSVVLLVVTLFVGTLEGISTALVVGFGVLAFLSATHDIAIDGLYLEALDEKDQSAYVGLRATFYRVASLFVVGPLLVLCDSLGWFIGLSCVTCVMLALTVYHYFALPDVEVRRSPIQDLARALVRPRLLLVTGFGCLGFAAFQMVPQVKAVGLRLVQFLSELPLIGRLGFSDWVVLLLLLALAFGLLVPRRVPSRETSQERAAPSPYKQSFLSFLRQERAGMVLAFVVLFRTGESFLMKMRWPFLDDVVQLTKAEYGILNGMIGFGVSFATTLLGGFLIARFGLRRCIWPFVLAQNVLNLLYMGVGLSSDPASLSRLVLGGVIAIEHAGAGLGTAVFMVFLMRACDPAHKAGHMAILTALMSVSFTVAGVLSGYLATALGFTAYFGFTFLATIPSMLMIPFLPHLDGRDAAPVQSP